MDDFISSSVPITNFFIYKNQRYPFNLQLFSIFSDYFSKNQIKLQKDDEINLVYDEKAPPLQEEAIKEFIQFCQKEGLRQINKENVLTLNYLAQIYNVQQLISVTETFISNNRIQFIVYFLLNPKSTQQMQLYEELLAKSLLEHVKDERIFSIPISSLHRVVTKYKQNSEDTYNPKFIDFLFDCLDHIGRKASIWFSDLDFNQFTPDQYHRLLKDYSEIFDFHFINSSFIKKIYAIDERQYDLLKTISEKVENLQFQKKGEVIESIEKLKCEIQKINQNFIQNDQSKSVAIDQILNENKLMKKRQENIERILYDIESSHYFGQNDNLETFNQLISDSQYFVFTGMLRNKRNKNISQIYSLLSYLMDEKTKTNYKDDGRQSFIFIYSNKMKESLMNHESIGTIIISSFTTEMLYENGSLNSNEFISHINVFNDLYVEIQYNGNDSSSNFANIYNIVQKLKNESCLTLKMRIKIAGIVETNQKFQNNQDISSIIFDSSVKTISGGNHLGSFENCASLEKVIMPDSITNIGGGAFYSCKKLKYISIPVSLTVINGGTFGECQSLAEVVIPSSVKQICSLAFQNCVKLAKIALDPYKTKLENDSFRNCNSLNCFEFLSSVNSIERFNFDDYFVIKEVIVPDSVILIKKESFSKCSKLEKLTMNPYSTVIEPKSFENCSSLLHFVFSSSITEIQQFDFNVFKFIKKITIPSSVTKIGSNSFLNCSHVIEIDVSHSITIIEQNALSGCKMLEQINVSNCFIKSIKNDLFLNCSSLKEVTIPDSV